MLLTVEQAAEELNVSVCTIREWAREGKIPARRFGRLWRFDKDELTAGKKTECPSTAIRNPHIGGYASRSAVEKFVSRQGQKTAKPPRSTNISSENATGDSSSSGKIIELGQRRKTDG